MSLGGVTAIKLASLRPDLVRRSCWIDITPGVTPEKSAAITAFVSGPATFASFDDLLPGPWSTTRRARSPPCGGDPPQRPPAGRRHLGLALRPAEPIGQSDGPHFAGLWTSSGGSRCRCSSSVAWSRAAWSTTTTRRSCCAGCPTRWSPTSTVRPQRPGDQPLVLASLWLTSSLTPGNLPVREWHHLPATLLCS